MDKREQIKKAIENKDDCCFKMALGLAELADEESIDLIYNQFFVKGNLKEIEKARKEILSFLSGANYEDDNNYEENDGEREILVGKLLNLQTFTGEYCDDDDYDYNDLDVYGLADSLEKLIMPFRTLIVNKLYEEAQDLHTHTLKRLKRLWEMRDEDEEITSLITIIMIAQPEFAYKLYGSQNTNLREVASRVTHVELGAINHELYEYFQHKFKTAGANIEKIITRDAVEELSKKFTSKDVNGKITYKAYPNKMNNVMKKLLNTAAAAVEEIINNDVIEMAGI